MARTNKNENPLRRREQIEPKIRWSKYMDKDLFTHLCTVVPDPEGERLSVGKIHDELLWKRRDMVYVFVLHGLILKIGQTTKTFEERLRSYNTGKMAYRSRGTNSGANFFILRSLLNIGSRVQVYGLYPEQKRWRYLGAEGTAAFPPAKVIEKVLLKRFAEEYGQKPIGCSQG